MTVDGTQFGRNKLSASLWLVRFKVLMMEIKFLIPSLSILVLAPFTCGGRAGWGGVGWGGVNRLPTF